MTAPAITKPKALVGQKIKRKEDPRLITGTATYVDDIKLPGMYHACILRSPYAAAGIANINVAAALELPGVIAVYTGADVKKVGCVPCALTGDHVMLMPGTLSGLRVPEHTILAQDRVYFVGHPVAVVIATDRYIARDAVDRVEVDWVPGEAVAHPEKALEPDAPAVHPQWPDNVAFTYRQHNGDADQAFAQAEVVVKQRIVSPRLVACPMEPRGMVADYHKGEKSVTLYTSTQIPHLLRSIMAAVLGIPESKMRVIAPEVGGGFGCKADFYAEEALMCFVAMQLGAPVKWIETRREHFLSTVQGRGHVDYYEIAAQRDGTILAIRAKIIQDVGAYQQLLTPIIPILSVLMLPGLYRCKAFSAEVVGAFTNIVPTDAYRGAGRPEATYCVERMVDMLAAELGMDPAEIRFKNFIEKQEFPFATGTGLVYDSGNYERVLKQALDAVDYTALREEQRQGRTEGKLLGIGISTYGEISAFGPSPFTPAGGWESATVRIEPSGAVTVYSGIKPQGQGEETTFAQIAADQLGVGLDDVTIVHGDTAMVQYGIGTFGSRATAVGGTAMYLAIEEIKKKMCKYAENMLGSDDVSFVDGVCTCNKTGKTATLAEIAGTSYRAMKLPPGTEPGLTATTYWEPQNFTFPFGAHIAVTEIDPETGGVKIRRYVAVDDCGRLINPLIVAGQVHGGIAQGISQALWEEAVYDDSGQLLTGEFTDYTIPKAGMMPWMETSHTETPSPVNPLGVKGVGEAGAIGAPPAIVNSVVDALSHLGVRHLDMPLTPEKIWRAIQGGRA
ncbi:MAG TPA: xanthine dehydrogenase family protein molybdopterin-binding subunit [Bryobacteraceae bacterium]|nr:xanthine dehydrogenase family protein molybdopterin-binding subunit [Bryobacteraceae bacterium]